MKLAVIAANGRVGSLVVKEALAKNIDVTAVVRSENKSLAKNVLKKDLFELTTDDLKDFDVVVDAFGTWNPDSMDLHKTQLAHISSILKGTKVRLVVVGGAGSLYTDASHSTRLVDTPDFPDAYKPVAVPMAEALNELRKVDDLDWTYISPAAEFDAEGKRTGEYLLGGEEFFLNEEGKSYISYADYAVAMVDEVIAGKHIKERISINSK